MPILYGAIAYREDLTPQFQAEIDSWDLAKTYPHPIACPKGAPCDKTYGLMLEVNASDETAKEYIDMVLANMEREECSKHADRIRMNPPR
jgi:hypothetical protein